MMSQLQGLYLSKFLIYFFIYPVYGYAFQVLGSICSLTLKECAILIIPSIMQVVTSFLITRAADSTKRHRSLLILCYFFYIAPLMLEAVLQLYFPTKGITLRLSILLCLCFGGLGGIMPLCDSLVLSFLINNKLEVKKHGIVKAVGVYGKIAASVFLALPIIPANNMVNLSLTFAGAFVLIPTLYFLVPEYKAPAGRLEADECPKEKTGIDYSVFKIFSPGFIILCLTSLLLGLQRNSVSHFLSLYFKAVNISIKKSYFYYAFHSCVELVVLHLNPTLRKYLRIPWLLYASVVFSALRVFIYAYLDISNEKSLTSLICIFGAETCKGIYMGALNISVILLADELAPPEYKTAAQGILYIFLLCNFRSYDRYYRHIGL